MTPSTPRVGSRSAPGSVTAAQILEALGPHVRRCRVDCRDALALAARLGIRPARVGQVCDRHGIKIANCQLGCFGVRGKRA